MLIYVKMRPLPDIKCEQFTKHSTDVEQGHKYGVSCED